MTATRNTELSLDNKNVSIIGVPLGNKALSNAAIAMAYEHRLSVFETIDDSVERVTDSEDGGQYVWQLWTTKRCIHIKYLSEIQPKTRLTF